MNRSEIENFLGNDWLRLETLISESLCSDVKLLSEINDNILRNSGKQLRPMVSLLMARACGDTITEDSIRYAAATELLHNATLLHDDVVDGSSERRGVPTVNSLLGGHASVLVGDFWLVKAMEIIVCCGRPVDRRISAVFTSTLCDLAEGEMFQLEKTKGADTTLEDYLRIIYSKTASLFQTSCVTAAISVDAPQETVDAAREYGRCLGMAFQIRDDILDYEGMDLGKPVGQDLLERKITLPLLGALSLVGEAEKKKVRRLVQDIPDHPENVESIRLFVEKSGGIVVAMDKLKEYVLRAIGALDVLPESKEREYLRQLAEYTVYRQI